MNKTKRNVLFADLSQWTVYFLGLLAAFMIVVQQNPQGSYLVPLMDLLFRTAQLERLRQKEDHNSKKFN